MALIAAALALGTLFAGDLLPYQARLAELPARNMLCVGTADNGPWALGFMREGKGVAFASDTGRTIVDQKGTGFADVVIVSMRERGRKVVRVFSVEKLDMTVRIRIQQRFVEDALLIAVAYAHKQCLPA
jgi:hypothetical protein